MHLLVTDPAALARAREVVDAELDAIEVAASRFRPDSEICALAEADGGETVRAQALMALAACFERMGCPTEFVPASIRSVDDFQSALAAGATGGIVFTGLFREMLDHPATAAALAGFDVAWKALPPTCLNS